MQTAMKIKQTAHQLIDSLPENTTWDKVLYTLQVRRDIEAGLADSENGRHLTTGELKEELNNEYGSSMDGTSQD